METRVFLKLTMYGIVAACPKKHLQSGRPQGPFQLSCNIFAVKVSARQVLQTQKTEFGLKALTSMALASHPTILSANSPQAPFFTEEPSPFTGSPGKSRRKCLPAPRR